MTLDFASRQRRYVSITATFLLLLIIFIIILKLEVMNSSMTIGFALPPFEDDEGEVLVSTSIPVPYGFAAFNTGYDVGTTGVTQET